MTKKKSPLTRAGAIALILIVIVPVALMAKKDGDTVVRVDCVKGDSLNEALERKADELIIEFEGVCVEDVLIRRDRTTLLGVSPDAAIVGRELPETPFAGVVTVVGAANVTLADFTVRDGRQGVVVDGGGAVTLERMTLQDHLSHGLALFQGSQATVADCTVVGNGRFGIAVWDSSSLRVGPGTTTIAENERSGMVASGSSSLSSSLGSRLELDDNGAYGLFMQIGATAQLGGHPGSEISVQRNGSVGLVAGWGSRLHARAEVRDNGFAGVYVGFGSSIDLDAPVTGNSVFGIWAEEDAAVDYNGPEISGHAVGMLLDGTEACITDATVSDPVQLVFGSRVHFTGGNDFTGGVTCDDTVLVRGDVSCPAPALSLAVTLDPRAKALAADLGGPFELER